MDGAAAPIKCSWDKSVTDVYENRFKNDKNAACKTIAQQVDAGDDDGAELGINQLLVALYNDYAACVGAPFGTQDLDACPLSGGASVDPAGVVIFAQATCDLAPGLPQTGDVDCVVPTVDNLAVPTAPSTDPTAEKAGGWIAAGPATEGASVVLPSGEFAVQLDDLTVPAVFVAMRENTPTSVVGECPINSDNDCVQNNYTVDMDNPDDPIADGPPPGLYVEICEGPVPFADVTVPARCAGGTCAPAEPEPARGLLSCSKGALAFAPSTWTAADGELAVRDVLCTVSSTSAAVSEGTTCTVFPRGSNDPIDSCLTVATPEAGPKAAQCTIPDILAAHLDAAHDGSPVLYTMHANKIESGVSHSGSSDFELSQTDPMFGNTKTVFVDVLPPGQQ
ncbi:MAG: hypothetical protein KAI97_08960 [Gemmatimonadetes bacterium]|nr:hypothetical protein [Gemmatimonadota bacterium]